MEVAKPTVKSKMFRKLLNRRRATRGKWSSSEEIDRIVPLGLTPKEARDWYRYDVFVPLLTKAALMIGFGSAIVLSMLTPIAGYLESTLTLHMIAQHLLFIAAGFLLSCGFDSFVLAASRISQVVSQAYTLLLKANARVNKRGVVTFVIAAILTAYWHIPSNFNAAVLNEGIHVEMHSMFLIVGGLIFVGSKLLTKRMRQFAPVIAGKGMGLFGAFLLVTPGYVYPVYPAWEQSDAGLVMVVMMLVMDLTIVPYWLYGYFGKSSV